jgi:CTP:molybdopterin cytidylyltransferase MocA
MLLKTKAGEIIVVLGAHAEAIKPHVLNHTNVKFVYNKEYNLGQTSSFQAGLRNISPDAQGILLLPVDYPLVQKDTVDTLIRFFLERSPLMIIPSFQGKKGHPPLFSASLKSEFLALDHKVGINTIAQAHQNDMTVLPVNDAGIIRSFNTPEEFKALGAPL